MIKRVFASRLFYAHTLVLGWLLTLPLTTSADPLNRAKVTQTVNDVKISNAQGGDARPAKPGSSFAIPELLRTGPNSRAELIAPDKTVTRVGSNTVFSFKQGKRGINLEQGSVLFHSPTGKGGGEVKTASATASVLGTTIIVAATSNGGFKFMVLEGLGKVIMPNGTSRKINAGNLTFIMPGANNIPQVFEFRLSAQTAGSALINGFNNAEGPVQSFLNKVSKQTQEQEQEIADGGKEGTTLKIGDTLNETDIEIIDAGSRTAFFEQVVEGEIPPQDVVKPANPFPPESASYLAYQGLCEDAVINTTTLDQSRVAVFTDGAELRAFLLFVGIIDDFDAVQEPGELFTARNLTFDTPTLDMSSQTLDDFGFLAHSNLTFAQQVTILNFQNKDLVFAAQGGIFFSTGSGIVADVANLELLSNGVIGGNGLTLTNNGGSLGIRAAGGVFISDSTITFGESSHDFNGLDISAGTGTIDLTGVQIVKAGGGGDNGPPFVGISNLGNISLEDVSFADTDSGLFIGMVGYGNSANSVNGLVSGDLVSGDGDDFTPLALPGTQNVTLVNTDFDVQDMAVNAEKDIRIATEGENLSRHETTTFYSVASSNGKVTIQQHELIGNNMTITGELDVSLGNLNITTNNANGNFFASSFNGDIHVNGGHHGMYAGDFVNAPPTQSYAYNAYNGSVRVNATGGQTTNFGSNDTSVNTQYSFVGSMQDGEVYMRNANFLNNVSATSLQAKTITVWNTSFIGNTTLQSYTGIANVNPSSAITGDINFMGVGNSYNGSSIATQQDLIDILNNPSSQLQLRDKDGNSTNATNGGGGGSGGGGINPYL